MAFIGKSFLWVIELSLAGQSIFIGRGSQHKMQKHRDPNPSNFCWDPSLTSTFSCWRRDWGDASSPAASPEQPGTTERPKCSYDAPLQGDLWFLKRWIRIAVLLYEHSQAHLCAKKSQPELGWSIFLKFAKRWNTVRAKYQKEARLSSVEVPVQIGLDSL